MKRKIAFLFCVIIIVFCKENYAKYIVEQTILIAEINIDTIFPEIELISITEIKKKTAFLCREKHRRREQEVYDGRI